MKSRCEGMAARDSYRVNLTCPNCGRSGEAQVSEDDYPFMASVRFRVDAVSEGFALQTEGENTSTTEFICTKCDVLAK
jgi:hypothetical protein